MDGLDGAQFGSPAPNVDPSNWMKKMTNVTAKIAFAALIASAPLAGAFAQPLASQMSPEDYVYSRSISTSVDNFTTASINSAKPAAASIVGKSPADRAYEASVATQREGINLSLAQRLDSQIRAAEANVTGARQNGFVDASRVTQLRSQINAVRQQAAGGVSEAAYQDLSAQLKTVNQSAYALVTG